MLTIESKVKVKKEKSSSTCSSISRKAKEKDSPKMELAKKRKLPVEEKGSSGDKKKSAWLSKHPRKEKIRKTKDFPIGNQKLDDWLAKKIPLLNSQSPNEHKANQKPGQDVTKQNIPSSSKITNSKRLIGTSSTKISTRSKSSSSNSTRSDFSSSLDISSESPGKSSSIKETKATREQKAFFKKYNVIIPTIDELLKEKEDYNQIKAKLEKTSFLTDFSEKHSQKLRSFRKSLNEKENILDCEHLSSQQLLSAFERNKKYLVAIKKKKGVNDDKRLQDNFNIYSNFPPGFIVFNFKQIEFLMKLVTYEFDPNDLNNRYCFTVLLAELCLRIFMECYDMKYEEAVAYLRN
ncbi:unnamed protein product [Phyllotreta striolata]|uniref:Uncharacterized protein n=1 Tax=Phyllotreta striolata TaxID=444603 RepID=A0A9P0DQY7_PHYSR|nr:unnamed protein product [Phyllotreta striolata]